MRTLAFLALVTLAGCERAGDPIFPKVHVDGGPDALVIDVDAAEPDAPVDAPVDASIDGGGVDGHTDGGTIDAK
jgi:hypothetical protein